MTRWRAAGVHLALTALLALPLCILFLVVWYPPPLLGAAGGTKLLLTSLLSLFVSGPLLTLLLYRPGKWGLRFDIGMIACLQAVALACCLYISFAVRPVYIAVLPMRATLVRANELHFDPPASSDYVHAPLWGAEYVGVVDPPEGIERGKLVEDVMSGLPDIDYRPAYYRTIAERMPELIRHAELLQVRIEHEPDAEPHYRRWLRQQGYADASGLRYYPLIASHGELELVIDERDRSIVGIMPLP